MTKLRMLTGYVARGIRDAIREDDRDPLSINLRRPVLLRPLHLLRGLGNLARELRSPDHRSPTSGR